MKKMFYVLVAALFMFVACGDDPTPVIDTGDTGTTQPDNDDVTDTASDADNTPVQDTENNNDADNNTTPDSNCSNELGKTCTTDEECGNCLICTKGGKCTQGCTTNEECQQINPGTTCNTKLARCVNAYASAKACSEASCPKGCCYAEKGLSGLKCLATPTAGTCGLCDQGEVYSPDDSKCLSAACSTTTDKCPTFNSNSSNPPAKCYECKAGDLICKANTSTSGCSAGTVINATQCVPAGQQCIEGVSECCSGMPCVQGYCY